MPKPDDRVFGMVESKENRSALRHNRLYVGAGIFTAVVLDILMLTTTEEVTRLIAFLLGIYTATTFFLAGVARYRGMI